MPDRYEREGAHNVSLEADRWNHVTVEIPHLHRDCDVLEKPIELSTGYTGYLQDAIELTGD